jgi:sarcosine oxidase subunit beta
MTKTHDIIIIGCGAVGSSIAYHLSENKQKEILVIDKDFPLSGTSGATSALVWVHTKTPYWYGELNMYSAELYASLKRKIGDIEYRRTGGITPFFEEEGFKKAYELAESQAKGGIEIDVLNREQVLEKEPHVSSKVAGATYSPMDGIVNPFRLVELYIKAARKNGVQFSFYNPVIGVKKENKKYKVTTKEGTYFSKQIVIAAGPWSKEVGERLGVTIPVKQVRGQKMVTEPMKPLFKHVVRGIRHTDNGEILLGTNSEEVGYDRSNTLDMIQDEARTAIKVFPDLAKANIVRCFSGVRVMPYDGKPILGEIPTIDNAFIAVMHSGITLSPIVGTLMTELLLEGSVSLDISNYQIDRFKEFSTVV